MSSSVYSNVCKSAKTWGFPPPEMAGVTPGVWERMCEVVWDRVLHYPYARDYYPYSSVVENLTSDLSVQLDSPGLHKCHVWCAIVRAFKKEKNQKKNSHFETNRKFKHDSKLDEKAQIVVARMVDEELSGIRGRDDGAMSPRFRKAFQNVCSKVGHQYPEATERDYWFAWLNYKKKSPSVRDGL